MNPTASPAAAEKALHSQGCTQWRQRGRLLSSRLPPQPLLIPSLPGKDGLSHPTVPLGDTRVWGEQWAEWDRAVLEAPVFTAERSDGAALVAFPAAHGRSQ